jgi:tetratricopeptide (TPR) repeat protein
MSFTRKTDFLNKRINLRARLWLFMLIALMLVSVRGVSVQAAWLKNMAVVGLIPLWIFQSTEVLDPSCPISNTFSEIEKHLQVSYQINLDDHHILTHIGRIFWLEGNCDEAITHWKQAYTLIDDLGAEFELFRVGEYALLSAETRLSLATMANYRAAALVNEGEEQTAYQWYRRAFILVPQISSANALMNLSGYPLDNNKLWLDLIAQLSKTEAAYWWAIAKIYEQHNDWEAAAIAYTQGVELTAAPYEFWMQTGFAWEEAEDWDKAITAFESAIQLQPDIPWPYLEVGNVYRIRQQYPKALGWYNKAKNVEPRYSDPYYFSGVAYYMMKDYAQARLYLEKAIEISPNHISARVSLAEVWYSENNLELAEIWMLDAINNAAVVPAVWWTQLGDWRLEWQDCLGARDAYTQALSVDKGNLVIKQKLTMLMETCEP